MKLKRLIKDLPNAEIKGSKEIEITGICAHSKQVAPGNLFIAKKGRMFDGSQYIAEAVETGAAAVLNDIFDPSLKVSQIIHPNVAVVEGKLVSAFYHRPGEELLMVGVTGTNGKTTVSYLIKHLFDSLEMRPGLIGTIEYLIGDHAAPATHTTPDVATNHKLLREMVNQRSQAAVMEVTSHALHQGRVSEISFDVGIFTNLSQDHLDYHKTMDAYCEEKRKLFLSLDPEAKKRKNYPKAAVVNIDDPWFEKIIDGCRVPIITYGIANHADLRAEEIQLGAEGIVYTLVHQGKRYPVSLPLIGRFNVLNSLATIGCGISLGVPLNKVLDAVKSFPPVPGRLEYVPNKRGLKLFVDFAHTPDALKNVLNCLKELTQGKLIVVFGCGGDRDPYKRSQMGRIAEEFSDLAIITSDNPRSENPANIMDQIAAGFNDPSCFIKIEDRRKAIEEAIHRATPEDVVLIAGRGHEPYQIFAHQTIEFKDREVVEDILHS